MEQDMIELADQANEVKTVAREAEGTWLPVPIPVLNPTVGSGLQAALLYMHPRKSEDTAVPNATSAIIGMYTDTHSWFAGGFHDGNWKEDLFRFRIIAGTGNFNLKYYGSGNYPIFTDNPVPYNITGDTLLTQLLRRIPGTRGWYLGMRYMYINSNVVFDFGLPLLPPISVDMTTSSLGLMMTYDNRDNSYYPTSGSFSEVYWMSDRSNWGSDFEFDKLDAHYNKYFPLTGKDTLVMRAALASAAGNVPFYLLPTLKMRGFPSGRYSDNVSLSGHVVWRRKFRPRWGFVLFSEAGRVADSISTLYQSGTITSVGGGLRWQVSADRKLNLGVDVGFSSGEYAIYVKVGEQF